MRFGNFVPLLLLVFPGLVFGAPVISMNWGSCTGPTHQANTGAHSYSLYISVTGIDRPHQAYKVWLGFSTAGDTTPDAWAFDPTGCQSPSLASSRGRRTARPAPRSTAGSRS